MSVIGQGTHTHPFNGPLSRTTRVSRYQKGKTNLDFTEARDSEYLDQGTKTLSSCYIMQQDNCSIVVNPVRDIIIILYYSHCVELRMIAFC